MHPNTQRVLIAAMFVALVSGSVGCSKIEPAAQAAATPMPTVPGTAASASPAPTPAPTPHAKLDAREWSRKTLAIEAERNELVAKVVQDRRQYSAFALRLLAYGSDSHAKQCDPARSLCYPRGWAQFLVDLVALNAPPELQAVKDSLVVAYQMELSAIAGARDCTSWSLFSMGGGPPQVECGETRNDFNPNITAKNVYEPTGGVFGAPPKWTTPQEWILPQKLRAQTYALWREILTDKKVALTEYPFTLLAE